MINFLKSISNITRLEILAVLLNGEFSVMEIVEILSMGQSRISRHLRILQESGVVQSRREGSWIYYSMSSQQDEFSEFISLITKWIRESENFEQIRVSIQRVIEQRRLRSKKFFSRIAGNWNILRNKYIDEFSYYSMLKDAIGKVSVLADLGCGTGETIEQLHDSSKYIIGIDNSPEMLQKAHEHLADWIGNTVDLRLGNLEHLPLKDQEVECILASLVLHHVAKPSDVFFEFNRVLKPGGKAIIVDFLHHKEEFFRDEMADLWLGFRKSEIKSWLSAAQFKHNHVVEISGDKSEAIKFVIASGIKADKF